MKQKILLLMVGLFSTFTLFSQEQKKDKGVYKPYVPGFYEEIQKSNLESNSPKKEEKKSFKMDFSGLDVPVSVDEFKSSWCNKPISQGETGTCWCFSTSSFYESEIFRQTGQQIKLSELYIVYYEYIEKAREFVKTRGKSEFGEGSETNAVKRMMKTHGLVPLEAYNGLKNGRRFHDHNLMFKEMNDYLQFIKTSSNWNEEQAVATVKSILNYYIGVPPTTVTVNGKNISPQEYLKNVAKINPDDYVDFMSLMENPYWKQSLYDVPDNWWRSKDYYNVPLDDFMNIIKSASKSGFTIAIGGDVSETGYDSHSELAMVPTYDIPSAYIDENARQLRFSNNTTTDDHAIHLIGYLEKPNGNWFLIKDSGSGGFNGKNKGYYFYHEDYIKLKIMSFTIHKDAVKQELKKFN
ncbi:MAG: peptidase C1 [Bacteroidetes bacterium]|nr:peptidase C1 [Bacteroidota bacterium]HET6243426.1 C1 family peptidase [Bacteroidia bacterium]